MEAAETHIFVVEDDPAMRQMVCEYLDTQGMTTTALASADELLRRIHKLRPDLILLDVGLPGTSGLEACQILRTQGDRIPIILLTARVEEYDRVFGLEIGADDYIGKPFSPLELLARIRAVLRRSAFVPGAQNQAVVDTKFGAFVFQPSARCLLAENGTERLLTTLEFALIAEFASNPNVALSRERLMSVVHGRGSTLLPRTIDVAVMRLRKIVEADPSKPRHIQSIRNFGYMFVPGSD
jgi:two-component system, OmpR family, phosphate regulon response regulator OmpR